MVNKLTNKTGDRLLQFKAFFRDEEYFYHLYHLAVPIALQNLITASLNMGTNFMVGQLGDVALASIGLAGQIFFLVNLFIFGISSGSAMFTAQLWGKKDLINLRKVLGLCLVLSLLISIIFFGLCEIIPKIILGFFSNDPQVISLGSEFLRIFAWTFIFFAITTGFASVLRSVGEVRLPFWVSILTLVFSVILNYLLLFGAYGFPRLGIMGVAYSAVISRILECLSLVIIVYKKKYPVNATISQLLGFSFDFVIKIFKPVFPVIMNEVLWSLAITMYYVVYARLGTPSLAAMNIVSTVDNLALVPFFGLSSGLAIITGQNIGAGEKERAYKNVGRTLVITTIFSLLISGIVLGIKGSVLSLYKITPDVVIFANRALMVQALWLIVRSQNMNLVVGMMRGGGDTRYSLFLDGIIIWMLGVPLVTIGGLIFHLPVYLVYLLAMSEELTKCILGLQRYFSKKWIHDLAHPAAFQVA